MQPLIATRPRSFLAQMERPSVRASHPAFLWFFAASLLLLLTWTGGAAEKVLWRLGELDRSEHEFGVSPDTSTNRPVLVRMGAGDETKRWPKFHPGSGNGAYGGRPYRYTVAFDLVGQPTVGVFFLDASLLFRQPRVPALEVDINGHRGRFYFDPDPMFEIGDGNDQFNPIRSVQRRKIALPASFFRSGENRITFVALDDPGTVVDNRTVGGTGDSGFFYDALALSYDSEATLGEKLSVSLFPTVLFPKSGRGFKEECLVTVGFPVGWLGGRARVKVGGFATEFETGKPLEFGEGRWSVLVPGDVPAGVAQIEFVEVAPSQAALEPQVCRAQFTPARKWKVFYAPSEHLDIGYTDYRPKVAEVHSRAVDELLGTFAAHPGYRFNLDGSWVADEWLSTRSSAQAAQLAKHARAGRLGMNAFYSSFVTDYASLETVIRNLYFSKELEARCGIPFDFALITDIPGNSWSVPSVLAAAGIRYFADGGNQDRGPLIAHGHWNARSPFWWEGPDGQRVLAWFSSHYHQLKAVGGLPPSVDSARGGLPMFLKTYEHDGYAPDAVLLYGTEVENLPFKYEDAAFVESWKARYAYPQIVTCRFSEFFQYIEKHYASGLPVVRGEAGAYWGDCFGMFALPTARDRANQARATAAESLASLTAALNPVLRFPRELDRELWRNILLYCEHTYGSHRTGGQPEHDEVIGQLREKEHQTLQAQATIDKLMRHGMSQLGDLIQTEGKNLVVFNPLSWPRSGLVEFQLDNGTIITNPITRQPLDYEVTAEKDGYQTVRFWANDVPALGYRVYPLGRGRGRQPAIQDQAQGNIVENKFYRLTLDPSRAAIRSLYDKELGRELVDGTSPYLLNEYLFVSGGGSETGRGRGAEDSRLLHPFFWLPPADLTIHHPEQGALVGTQKTPWGLRIRMVARALHTPRIETEILLPDDAKRVELRNVFQVDLLYAKQASYFAFPWAMDNSRFRYDIANGFVDPAKDLLEGGCSDWFSLQQVVNIENGSTSVDLAVADAPLVCLGDICRGRWSRQFEKNSSTVFSYVLNNYWSSKWAGQKSWELTSRYSITSGGRFEPAKTERFGLQTRSPLEISEIKSSDKLPGRSGRLPPAQASLATLTPDNVVLTALKAAEDGRGLVLRVLETGGRECDGVANLPLLRVKAAKEADAMETPGRALKVESDGVRFHIKPHQVLTMRLETQ